MLFFVGGYGLLNAVNPFKDKKIYGILAFLIAVVMVLTPQAVQVVMTATPWLVILVMMGFFFIFYSMMFGVKEEGITAIIKGSKGWLIMFVVIIFLFAIGTSFGPSLTKLSAPDTSAQPTINPNEPVFDAQGNIVPAGSIGATGTNNGGVATGDFGTNLIFTLFNPKILGVLFIFLLGTLTVILLNDAGAK
jgi:hypothetical protein